MMKDVFKSVTDERLVLDILVPGYGKDAVTVKTARVNNGEAFKIIVEGKYIGRKNKNNVPVPRIAFEKYVEDFKYVFSDNTDFGDDLFRSQTFVSGDYDLDKICYDVVNGVIRISIPKTDLAKGKAITASENADKDSSGVATSDSVANSEE